MTRDERRVTTDDSISDKRAYVNGVEALLRVGQQRLYVLEHQLLVGVRRRRVGLEPRAGGGRGGGARGRQLRLRLLHLCDPADTSYDMRIAASGPIRSADKRKESASRLVSVSSTDSDSDTNSDCRTELLVLVPVRQM